jgi:hypothetical protein
MIGWGLVCYLRNASNPFANLPEVSLRQIQARAFTVVLRDGREVVVTPIPWRISEYGVTIDGFKERVRAALDKVEGGDPAAVPVLGGIPVSEVGRIPTKWENEGDPNGEVNPGRPARIRVSIGEPLDHFAVLEIRGQKKP